MEKFKNVVIGFGKAGKTLAKFLAQHDEEVLLIRCMAAPALTLAVCRPKI